MKLAISIERKQRKLEEVTLKKRRENREAVRRNEKIQRESCLINEISKASRNIEYCRNAGGSSVISYFS